MLAEPATKRVIAFVDGQNLYHGAKEAFGYPFPNYDVQKLAAAICAARGWMLTAVRFYTGYPAVDDDAFWHHFWMNKLSAMGRRGVHVFKRELRYRNRSVKLPDGRYHSFLAGEEKGVDVRIAIDILRAAHRGEYDLGLILSQDQDLSEVVDEIQVIAGEQGRWIRMASAFPSSPISRNTRGVNGTHWVRIDRGTYDACIDPRDYRARGGLKGAG